MQLSRRKCIFLRLLGLRKMVLIFTSVLKQFQSCDKMKEIHEYQTIMVAFILCIYSSLERFLTQENYGFSYYLKVEKYISFFLRIFQKPDIYIFNFVFNIWIYAVL